MNIYHQDNKIILKEIHLIPEYNQGEFMKVGKAIRKIRRDKEMSQVVLAKKLGTTQRTICWWEHDRGDITVRALGRIAEVFDVPMKVFFEGQEDCRCKS